MFVRCLFLLWRNILLILTSFWTNGSEISATSGNLIARESLWLTQPHDVANPRKETLKAAAFSAKTQYRTKIKSRNHFHPRKLYVIKRIKIDYQYRLIPACVKFHLFKRNTLEETKRVKCFPAQEGKIYFYKRLSSVIVESRPTRTKTDVSRRTKRLLRH